MDVEGALLVVFIEYDWHKYWLYWPYIGIWVWLNHVKTYLMVYPPMIGSFLLYINHFMFSSYSHHVALHIPLCDVCVYIAYVIHL